MVFTPESVKKAQETRKANGYRRPSRKEKMAAYADTFARQRAKFPKIALPIIDQVEKGSLTAAVKLMCLECSGWVRQEVRDCVIGWCPLYPVRPFQDLRGRNPNDAELTQEKVERIRQQYRSGEATVPQLAERFGISRLAVQDVLTGASTYTVLPKGH